jgi:hypothetical protein
LSTVERGTTFTAREVTHPKVFLFVEDWTLAASSLAGGKKRLGDSRGWGRAPRRIQEKKSGATAASSESGCDAGPR